jgi:hypothetical protein
VTAVVRAHLGRERFATMAQPSLPYGRRYRRIGEAIEREQHAAVTLYDANLPFVGAGSPYKPWSFALELRRKEPQGTQAAQSRSAAQTPTYYGELGVKPPGRPPLPWEGPDDAPGFDEELQQPAYQLTSRHIFDGIKPQLLGLRESVALSGRDSLRGLDVDECVYLPYGARRDSGVYEPESVKQQLADPDDGGEARRVYLRVRVGSWQEQLVVSLFVRVHTHGGMLVLEVVPHVLGPIAEEFREADALVERRADGVLHEALRVLVTAPAATAAVGFSAVRALSSAVRAWFRGPESAAPDAARVSLRELAATDDLSLFQEMDVSRYIKSVQDRIASGVRDALDERGFRTDRFEQLIMQVRSVSTARK